jgi:hypothetical protein
MMPPHMREIYAYLALVGGHGSCRMLWPPEPQKTERPPFGVFAFFMFESRVHENRQ